MKPTPCFPIGRSTRVVHHDVGRAFMTPAKAVWLSLRPASLSGAGADALFRADWSPGASIAVKFWSRPGMPARQLAELVRKVRERPLSLVRVVCVRLLWPSLWPKN